MRKQVAGIILALALLAMCQGAAHAAPSFKGYTGLVVVPTCDTLNRGEFNFGVMTEDVGEFEANDVFANFSPADCLEVGLNSYQVVNSGTRETLLNSKYCFLPETDQRAGVAFGIIDLTDEIESTVYAVASKSIARGLRVFDSDVTNLRINVGVGGGRLSGLFGGLSAFAGNRVMFSLEWDSADVNIGFRFTPVRGLRLHAGWFDVGGSESTVGLGLSFTKAY